MEGSRSHNECELCGIRNLGNRVVQIQLRISEEEFEILSRTVSQSGLF